MPRFRRLAQFSKLNLGGAFGVPHTFNPNLSLLQAVFAAAIAFVRIFLASFLFALWGVATWTLCASIRNPAWRIVTLIAMIVVFLGALAALMLTISAIVRRLPYPKPDQNIQHDGKDPGAE